MQSLNRRYIPELDQLRAYASVLVLLYHSFHTGRATFGHTEWPRANVFDALLIEGHTGVALFMVVSGFVLADGTLGKNIEYRSFLYNRFVRIVPLMTLVMVFAIYANKDVTLQGILSPFLLLANTQPRFFPDVTYLSGTLWTISVEFQFYLVAPFVFLFTSRYGVKYLFLLMFLCFVLRCLALFPYTDQNDELYLITYYTIVGRMPQFLVGVVLAYFWPKIRARLSDKRRTSSIVLGLSIAATVAMSMVVNAGGGNTVWHPWMLFYREIEALVWAAVVGSYVLTRPWEAWPNVSRFINGVGVISFSIYILHWSIEKDFWAFVSAHGLGPAEPRMAALLGYAILILIFTLASSALSYAVIEKPFLTLRKRYVEAPEARLTRSGSRPTCETATGPVPMSPASRSK